MNQAVYLQGLECFKCSAKLSFARDNVFSTTNAKNLSKIKSLDTRT